MSNKLVKEINFNKRLFFIQSGHFRKEILEELKNAKYNDLEDMVYRMQLTYDEILDILDLKYISSKRTSYSLQPGFYQVTLMNTMPKLILPKNMKLTITIDDIRTKSNLKPNRILIFTKKSFFYTNLGVIQSHLEELGDIDGFFQLTPGLYKSEKPSKITGTDKALLKCDCNKCSTLNGVRETILYCFALTSPPGHKIYQEPGNKPFGKINESVLSHITFHLEDGDYKPVDFNE